MALLFTDDTSPLPKQVGGAGCTLPVEMFFPGSEFPSLLLEDALAELGVTCRRLPELESSQDAIGSQSAPINGFTLKIAALILSQYEEVSPTPLCSVLFGSHTGMRNICTMR